MGIVMDRNKIRNKMHPIIDRFNTVEITRCCVMENVPNGASRLMGAACRVAKELGYGSIITYTLASESGESLKATGFTCEGEAGGGQWDRRSRRRQRCDEEDEAIGPKRRWRKELCQ
jgi:hypothetical protein